MKTQLKLSAAIVLAAGATASAQTLYETSFEAPTYFPGVSIVGTDGWAAGSGSGNSQTVSDALASTGTQSLLWDNTSLTGFYSVRREMPPVSDLVSASVDIWISSSTGANRLYGIYFVSSPTSTLGGTNLGITIGGDGVVRGGKTWGSTYQNTGTFFTADPGTYAERWLTMTLTWDPGTADGTITISGFDGATPVVSMPFDTVGAPLGLNLGSDYFSTTLHTGMAYMDNLVISEVPGIIGACCVPDGSCLEVREIVCVSQGGTYHGDNTSCATTPPGGCPQPPVGACCVDDGSCTVVWEPACIAANGIYQGNGTDCTTACPQPAACCFTNFSCGILGPVSCAAAGGTYQGTGADCSTCPPPPPTLLAVPNFSGLSRTWAFAPSHSQVLSNGGGGAFNVTGFRLIGTGEATTSSAWHSDMLMELISPNGTALYIGGQTGTPSYPKRIMWDDLLLSGTRPPNSTVASAFDGTYSWDFGPIDGEWTVNFWNSWTTATSVIPWNNVTIEMLDGLPTGACCIGGESCIITTPGTCEGKLGFYYGDSSTCGGVSCLPFLATSASSLGLTGINNGIFMDLTASQELTIHGFDYSATAAAGTPTTVEVWTIPMSYIGNDQNQSAWTLHDTVFSTSGGPTVLVPLELNVPISIGSGQTVGVYLVNITGGLRYFTSLDPTYEDDNLSLFSSLTRTALFAGTAIENRAFSGRIYYDATPICYANCDGSTIEPILNVDDFTCFINEFAGAQALPHSQQVEHYANCDGSTIAPVLNVDDFTCFINAFAAGCP